MNTDHIGIQLHYSHVTKAVDGILCLEWRMMKYKPDFVSIVKKYGTIPVQTSADILTLTETLRKKEEKIKE